MLPVCTFVRLTARSGLLAIAKIKTQPSRGDCSFLWGSVPSYVWGGFRVASASRVPPLGLHFHSTLSRLWGTGAAQRVGIELTTDCFRRATCSSTKLCCALLPRRDKATFSPCVRDNTSEFVLDLHMNAELYAAIITSFILTMDSLSM